MCLLRREGVLRGVQAEGRRRFGPGGQLAHVRLLPAAFVQAADQPKVNLLDLPGQRFALAGIEVVPERQQMLLAVRAEDGQ